MGVLEDLEERGYIEQLTHDKELRDELKKGNIKFYIGIDPTADSLHIGHYIALMIASYLQKAGNTPIIVIGGGTAVIGDPSGRTDMRKMLTREELDSNVESIKKQVSRFLSFEGDNAAIFLNNKDWICDLKFLDFMKDIGTKFTVSKMVAQECYKTRLETGLTFFEMGYLLLQSYDFLYLHDNFGCKLEIGGNDQWSNILGGVDLIRKMGSDDAYGLTFKLLTTKDGKKMGKTAGNAIWLNPDKTSPYDFYQYWRNIDDCEIRKIGQMLTFLPMDEIDRLDSLEGEEKNKAKEILAYEITKQVHGEENAKKASDVANSLFGNGKNFDNMPSINISNININILDAIILANFASSKSQAKTLINQGGISLNDKKILDISYNLNEDDFKDGYAILKKGKKAFIKLKI